MTDRDFLRQFEEALLVGQPARTEIIDEVRAHLADLEPRADPVRSLGRPERLAREENRTWLGPFASIGLLLVAPPVIGILLLGLSEFSSRLSLADASLGGPAAPPSAWLNVTMFNLVFFVPIVIAAIIGRTLGRMHRPWVLFGLLGVTTLVTFFLIMTAFFGRDFFFVYDAPTTADVARWMLNNVMASFIGTIILMAVAVGGLVATSPAASNRDGSRRFDAVIAAGICLIVLFATFGLVDSFNSLAGYRAPNAVSIGVPVAIQVILIRYFIRRSRRPTPSARR